MHQIIQSNALYSLICDFFSMVISIPQSGQYDGISPDNQMFCRKGLYFGNIFAPQLSHRGRLNCFIL